MKQLKRILTSMAVTLGFMAPAFMPVMVSAADPAATEADANVNQALCNGANLNFSGTDESCEPGAAGAGDTVDNLVADIINVISLVVGVVSVIMIIIGGLRYITSNGDSGNVTNAKNTILYAIIGLVIVALAQLIVRFVLERTASTAE